MRLPKWPVLVQKGKKLFRAVSALQIPVHAANASYFIILSVFPMLVLLLGLLRYTPLDAVDLLQLLEGILPAALQSGAEELILRTYRDTSGILLGVSAVTALWSASRGIYGLLRGLNAVYGVREDRGYIFTRAISVLYTFLFLLVLLLTLVLHVFGTALLDVLSNSENPLLQLLTGIVDLRYFLLVFLQTMLFSAMFMVFPNKRNRFAECLPGALLASIGWLVFSYLYSWYVENFPAYSNMYGPVYAVALSMLWLYFCLTILFYGGLLNRALTEKES